MKGSTKLVAAGAAALVMASGAHHHGHGLLAVLDSAHAAAVPSGGTYTPASWARAFLRADGLPRTSCNKNAIVAWENAEGGNWANSAQYNPLDTTQQEPGSWAMNSVGVQAYLSWQAGFQATVTTLNNGNYPGIISALQAGGNAQAVADAVSASPWGTGYFPASC